MKAWQFVGAGKPLELNEVPELHAGPGEVVVAVKAAGICHSDVSGLYDPTWAVHFPILPHTFGHENAGVIIELGEGMDHWKIGDRVGLSPAMPDGSGIGYGKWPGGFGPQVLATEANLVPLPEEVSFAHGAMATDAGLTAYHAVMVAGAAKAGMKVGIIGLGGLGYIGARVAVLAGAEVYGAEINPATRDLADEIGLAGVAESIDAFADKGLDLIVDFAGFGTTTSVAVESLAPKGTLVQVGMARGEAAINTYTLILKQLTIKGSLSGTKEDLAALYEMMKSGQLNPPTNLITQQDIPASMEKLHEGGVVGRFIVVYDD